MGQDLIANARSVQCSNCYGQGHCTVWREAPWQMRSSIFLSHIICHITHITYSLRYDMLLSMCTLWYQLSIIQYKYRIQHKYLQEKHSKNTRYTRRTHRIQNKNINMYQIYVKLCKYMIIYGDSKHRFPISTWHPASHGALPNHGRL